MLYSVCCYIILEYTYRKKLYEKIIITFSLPISLFFVVQNQANESVNLSQFTNVVDRSGTPTQFREFDNYQNQKFNSSEGIG